MISVLSKVTLWDNMSCTFVMNLKVLINTCIYVKIKTKLQINLSGFKFKVKIVFTLFIQSKIPLVSM